MSKLPYHISGKLHLTGTSRFVADEAPLSGMLYAKFLFSPLAHARLIKLDLSAAAAYPGIHQIISAQDVPGANMIGHVIKDEPLFPAEIKYVGQPLAMVLSEDISIAEHAVSLIQAEYEDLAPIFDVETADQKQAWYVPERQIASGNVERALAKAEFTLSGSTRSAGQEHFYLETQRARAIPMEDKRLLVQTATQSTMECQEVISHVLGIPAHNIIIEVPRLGGAFGGKERAATIWASLAALAAYVTKRPVEILLTQDEDMKVTGKRHPFLSQWKVGYDSQGTITAFDITLLANGGAYADLSVAILERAMFHAENCLHIPDIRIRGRACITNLPPNTAFRGFGAPQGIFVIESIITKIAHKLGVDAHEIRKLNAYKDRDITPYGQRIDYCPLETIYQKLEAVSGYEKLRAEVESFNRQSSTHKQGLAITPVKFGISFTTALLNQGSALVWIYIDGSVSVTTGGIEMGQELSTKVAIVVARTLGIPFDWVHVESANSQRVGNASPTAASTGSDINGNAARIACEDIMSKLKPAAADLMQSRLGVQTSAETMVFADGEITCPRSSDSLSFKELVRYAYESRIPLAAYGYYSTPGVYFDREKGIGKPFHYYVYGAALSRVELCLLTGEHRLQDTWIVHENGTSLSAEIDRGQIIGAFIQGMGWCTMEELSIDDKGRYQTVSPSTYKVPGIRDVPEHLSIEILESGSDQASVYGSKATGEPPLIYGMSVFFALQNAIQSINPEAELKFPATPEAILSALQTP